MGHSAQSPFRIAADVAEILRWGDWTEGALVRRGEKLLGRRPRWLRPVVRELLEAYPAGPPPNDGDIVVAILGHARFQRAVGKLSRGRKPLTWLGRNSTISVEGRCDGAAPPLTTVGLLAEWLELPPRQLDWLADAGCWEGRTDEQPLLNYRYRWLRKRTGAWRLIEIPKRRLRAIQRKLLDEILAKVPVHDAVHGFQPGRSTKSFVAPHVGAAVAIRLDLADFFPSISERRVRAIFRAIGYRTPLARVLAGLCTNSAAREVFRALPEGTTQQVTSAARRLYGVPHLPQGAPTSPALANLAAWKLDKRLAGLARKVGAHYTRYADDLLFSGGDELARRARRFTIHVAAIAMEEGFAVAFRKTRIMRRGARQHAAGLVINQHPNIRRTEYDRLKATLHNCLQTGPATQNRAGHPDFRAHLSGRVGYVETINPARGRRLRSLLERIEWDAG